MTPLRLTLERFALRAYRSRRLAQAIFGISFLPADARDYYFDVTTAVLVRAVASRVRKTDHVLDLGTGAHAVVGLSLWKRTGCRVTCSDIDPQLVALAAKNITNNGAPLEVIRSRLFADVSAPFNVIVFNPPYLPSDDRGHPRLEGFRRNQWDGGADGTRVIRDFLTTFEARPIPARAYLGINRLYVPRDCVRSLIHAHRALSLIEIVHFPFLPPDVYVLENRSPRVRSDRAHHQRDGSSPAADVR